MPGSPTPIIVTDSNGNAYVISGASSGAQVAAPTPVVLTDANGNALVLGAGSLPSGTTGVTQAAGDSTTKLATDQFVTTAIANAIAGVNPAEAVLAASTANVVGTYVQVGGGVGDTFTVTATGAFSLDGVAINTIGQRVLLKNQTTGSQNGIYSCTTVGAGGISAVFTRAADYNTVASINNTGAIPVQSGTANTTTSWLLTSQVTSVGSAGSSLVFAQFSYAPAAIALLSGASFTGAVQIASGQVLSWNSDTSISRDSAGVIDIGTGAQGSKAGTINATTENITGVSSLTTVKASKSITTGINALGNVSGALTGGSAIDLSLGNVVTMTLTGNVTSSAWVNAVAAAGQEITVIITQDGTGGRTIAWPTATVGLGAGIGPAPTLALGSVSIFKGIVDGSGNVNWITNGPVIVYRNTVASVTTSDTSHETLFTPVAGRKYRCTANVTCTTTGTTATMSVNTTFDAGNISSNNPSKAVACTATNLTSSSIGAASPGSAAGTMGWVSTLTNAIGTAVFAIDFIVEDMGN